MEALQRECKDRHAVMGQSRLVYLEHAAAFGRSLSQLKEAVGHGNWETWVRQTFHFSEDTAGRFMRLGEGWHLIQAEWQAHPHRGIGRALKRISQEKARPRHQQQVPVTAEPPHPARGTAAHFDPPAPGTAAEAHRALYAMKGALSRNNVVEHSDHFIFGGGVGLQLKVGGGPPAGPLTVVRRGAGQCPLRRARKTAADLPEWDGGEQLSARLDDQKGGAWEVVLRTRRSECRLPAVSPAHLGTAGLEPPGEFMPLPDADAFIEAAGRACDVASEDASDIRSKVRLHPDWVQATDNFAVFRHWLQTGLTQSVLIPARELKGALQADPHQISESENWVHFRNPSGLVYSVHRWEGGTEYPKLAEYLTVPDGQVAVAWPASFRDTLKRVDAVRKQIRSHDDPDAPLLRVRLEPGAMYLQSTTRAASFRRQMGSAYDGPPLEFSVKAEVLQYAHRLSEAGGGSCTVSEKGLWVRGDAWVYVAATREERVS